MTRSKIPTLLAIFVLISGVVATLFAINKVEFLKSSAQTSFSPQDVKITNLEDTSVTISWVTDSPSIGLVEYTNQEGQRFQSGASILASTHWIVLSDLIPNTLYSFTINSAGNIFDNLGSPWQVQTLISQSPQIGTVISGSVLKPNAFPAKNALVYVTPEGSSYIASALVSASGNWILSIPQVSNSSILDILVENSTSEISTAKIDVQSANPVPTITVGKSYNFSNQSTNSSIDTPKVPITLP